MPSALLFVCLGNICRSPTAAAVVRARLGELGLGSDIRIDSAATHPYRVGHPAHADSVRAARKRGYDLGAHRARQVEPQDFHQFDYIIAMDNNNLRHLQEEAPQAHHARLCLMMSFAPYLGALEVPDPYGGVDQDFERVLDLVEGATTGLVRSLFGGRASGF